MKEFLIACSAFACGGLCIGFGFWIFCMILGYKIWEKS